MRALRHLLAICRLPGMVAGVIPALLVEELAAWPLVALGAVVAALGLALIVQTVALFASVGKGTLAPWDPTERLVVRGPYRRVRNPMISGVLCVLLGEALAFGSVAVLVWFAIVFVKTIGKEDDKVVNPLVMWLMFFAVITPFGLVRRLVRRDPLGLRREPKAASYWICRHPPGPAPETIERQF